MTVHDVTMHPPRIYPRSVIQPQPKEVVSGKVALLDLSPIAYKLMHPDDRDGWSQERVVAAIGMYRKFLIVNGMYPTRPHVPTPDIDAVWHVHMQDTAKYRVDCQYVFGAFLDHFPYLGLRGKDDAEALAASFAETRELFVSLFGHDICIGNSAKIEPQSCVGNGCSNGHVPDQDPSSCVGNGCSNGTARDARPAVDFVV